MFVCFDGPSVVVNNSGGSRGGARGARPLSPLVLDQTEALKAEKKNFPHHPPPPPYLRAKMTAPPYLRVWIRH